MRPEIPITVEDLQAAQARSAKLTARTPLVLSPGLSSLVGDEVLLKMETLQPTGSFKVRGAASKVLALTEEERARGVVTASTGNHGRAVAYVASKLSVPATVCVSTKVAPAKVEALAASGCRVVQKGESQTQAMENALRLVADEALTLVHPFDDRDVIAGQGTIGLEIIEERADVEEVVVPLSGGGLISGIALAAKSHNPACRVIGVSMERAPAMALSLEAGHPVEVPEEATLADSLQGGIGSENRYTFAMVSELVDRVVLLNETEIWEGMLWAYRRHGLLLEGAGAVGIAALLSGKLLTEGPAVLVCSGRNLEPEQLIALGRGQSAPKPHT